MSQFYRCDGCGAEADHPGVDYGMEETYLPEGWKTGPRGDFCPKHPMRVADGVGIMLPAPRGTSGWRNSGEEPATVKGYSSGLKRYNLVWWPGEAAEKMCIVRSAKVVEHAASRLTHSSWVPL